MNKILSSIVEVFLLIKFRGMNKTHNIFNKFISNSKSVLLIASGSDITDNSLLDIVKYFVELGKSLTVIIPSTSLSRFVANKNVQFITYNPIDISFCGLPKQRILENLIEKEYDITIDLSLGNNLFNKYLLRFSKSNFTIGFEKNNSDKYYNFQIKAEINSENSYKNLLNSIRMF